MHLRQKNVWTTFVSASLMATVVLGAAILGTSPANGEMVQLWQVGDDNGSNSDFGQEVGGSNPAPGSATIKDDDWYFAGTYPDPIGTVAADEPFLQFERALTTTDTTVRIHFNLSSAEAAALQNFELVIETLANDNATDTQGDVPFSASFNGNVVFNGVVNTANEQHWVSSIFSGGSVGAVEGENIITITREVADGQRRWIQFDLVRLNIEEVPEPSTLALGVLGLFGLTLYGWRRKR